MRTFILMTFAVFLSSTSLANGASSQGTGPGQQIRGATQESRQPRVAIEKVYQDIQKVAAGDACRAKSVLVGCVYQTVDACQAAVAPLVDACIENDRKHHENFRVTEDQAKTEKSAMLTCAETTALHKLAVDDQCMAESKLSPDDAPYAVRYLAAQARERRDLKAKIETAFGAQNCANCVGDLFKSSKLTSVATAQMLWGAIDRSEAPAATKLDWQMTLVEHLNVANFTLSEMAAGSLGDEMARDVLLNRESTSLEQLRDQTMKVFDDGVAAAKEAASDRAPASGGDADLKALKQRLKALKARKFTLK